MGGLYRLQLALVSYWHMKCSGNSKMQVTSQDLKRAPDLPEMSILKNPFEGVPQAERVKLARERGEKAKKEFAELTESLAGKLKPVEPVHAVCSAGYLLVFIG